MSFLSDIEQLRKIEWGRAYAWDIVFPDAPQPFNSFFPAVDVSEPIATLQWLQENYYIDIYRFPQNKLQQDLRITFLDDQNGSLLDWFQYWINTTIFNDGQAVSPIGTAGVCKTVMIAKLDSYRNVLKTSSYLVFPEGIIDFIGGSESSHVTYSVNFVIAGIIARDNLLYNNAALYSSVADVLNGTPSDYMESLPEGQALIGEEGYYDYEVPSIEPSFPAQTVNQPTWYDTTAYNLGTVSTKLSSAATNLRSYTSSMTSTATDIIRNAANIVSIKNKIDGISTQVTSLKTAINRVGTAKNITTQATALSTVATKVNTIGISTVASQLTGMAQRLNSVSKSLLW